MSTHERYELVPEWSLGDRLRKARTLTGMTVAEFAKHIGVSDGTINSAEGDKRAVRRITLMAWASATNVSLKWLETGEGERTPPTPGPGKPATSKLTRLTDQKRSRSGVRPTRQYLAPAYAAA